MDKTPKTVALLRELWRQYRAGEREHPLANWARGSEWKDEDLRFEGECECGSELYPWQKPGELCQFCESNEVIRRRYDKEHGPKTGANDS